MTRFWLLLRAELLKLRRSHVFLVCGAAMLAISMVVPGSCAVSVAWSGRDNCSTGLLLWPHSLYEALDFFDGAATPIPMMLFAWFIGSEFSRDTWKMGLPRWPGRAAFVLAKAMACLLGFLSLGSIALVGWLLVAFASAPLLGLENATRSDEASSIDVLARLPPADSRPEGASFEEYRSARNGAALRLESHPLPLPSPPVSEGPLGADLHARVPHVLPANRTGTLPSATGETPTTAALPTARSRSVRLAATMQAAASVLAFHPHHHRTVDDLDAVILAALTASAEAPGETGGPARIAAALLDGHAGAHHPSAAALRALPWSWEPVGNDLVITAVAPTGGQGVQPGDRVLRFGGETMETVWARWMQTASGGTPSCRRHHAARGQGALLGPANQSVELEVESLDGTLRTVTVAYATTPHSIHDHRSEPISELDDGTLYVDLSRVDDASWKRALKRLAPAERVIFDLREYPGDISRDFLRHLHDTPVHSDTFSIPVWDAPGSSPRTLDQRWVLTPTEPRLGGRFAFLSGPRSISFAESILGVVQRNGLGAVVGAPSCGSNGNITQMELIGGTRWVFTGLDTLGPDGSRNPTGIAPDVAVQRTRAGIAAGRDEVLEAAQSQLQPTP